MATHKITFPEIWEETIELTDEEVEEWIEEIKEVLNNDKISAFTKLQYMLDNVWC